jgi:drug/metabolite transporter (DMT)-like permease
MTTQSETEAPIQKSIGVEPPVLEVPRLAPQAGAARGWVGLALVIFATLAWSTGGVFITRILQSSTVAPMSLAFWRVLCTFLILLTAIAIVRPQLLRIARRDLVWLGLLGAVAMGIFQVLWITSVLANGLSVATVIQCNAPVIVTVLAWVFWKEPLTWRKWTAIAMAFAGTVLIARPAATGNVHITALGLALSLGAAIAYAAITLFTKKLTGNYGQWTILVYAFGFAALALLPFQFGRPLPSGVGSEALGAFVAFLLITTIGGYALYATALKSMQASVASIAAMSEVPFAAFWGYALLHERLDGTQIVGALVVIGGVLLLSVRQRGP